MDIELVDKISFGLMWGTAFIFSATAHEAAHAFVAHKGGDDTAYAGGQVTLNPIPHIVREPVGMVVVPLVLYALFGYMFGWASAPINPYWADRYPRRAAWMAAAGPAANLLIALLAVVFGRVLFGLSLLSMDADLANTVFQFVSIFVELNLMLFVFNLIPVSPLDGARAIVLIFPERIADRVLEKTHALGFMGIFLAWMIMGRIFGLVNLNELSYRLIVGN